MILNVAALTCMVGCVRPQCPLVSGSMFHSSLNFVPRMQWSSLKHPTCLQAQTFVNINKKLSILWLTVPPSCLFSPLIEFQPSQYFFLGVQTYVYIHIQYFYYTYTHILSHLSSCNWGVDWCLVCKGRSGGRCSKGNRPALRTGRCTTLLSSYRLMWQLLAPSKWFIYHSCF